MITSRPQAPAVTRGDALRARWAEMAPREQQLVVIAVVLVVLALLWWVALAPALRTLSAARAEHAQLDAQLQQMTSLQQQAKALQSQPKATRDDALRALESSVRGQLAPSAQIGGANAGEGVSLTLRGTSAEALAPWLAQARANARALPREAHLTRSQAAAGASGADDARKVQWDGTLIMSLPAPR